MDGNMIRCKIEKRRDYVPYMVSFSMYKGRKGNVAICAAPPRHGEQGGNFPYSIIRRAEDLVWCGKDFVKKKFC